MVSENLDIKTLITGAWEKALHRALQTTGEESRGQVHRDRSNAWVDCLGKGFQEKYQGEDQLVFWRQNNSNKSEFRLSELLFDVSVCKVDEVQSIEKKKTLQFVSKCYWQVESELNDSDSKEITKDFSKLVIGLSDDKLFVSSYQGARQEQILSMCSSIARKCAGNLYMCFIEHPNKWKQNPAAPVVFRWDSDKWNPL
ncbi:MAG: hypothetical protein F4185_01755 [Chloroflexi bacterium]|nr:hypothetical protein [Chloroflexota bacterium]MYF64717.1 hypothetical protein [Chloroflexota bacterium]MYK33816.1 hypothetical protein [Chloroflexota bacterium]